MHYSIFIASKEYFALWKYFHLLIAIIIHASLLKILSALKKVDKMYWDVMLALVPFQIAGYA